MWPSHWEILIIFVVVLLLFGAKRIPEMAQGLGKGIREFRKAMRDVQEDIDAPAGSGAANNIAPKPEAPAEQVARETATAAQDAPSQPQASEAQPSEQEKQAPQ